MVSLLALTDEQRPVPYLQRAHSAPREMEEYTKVICKCCNQGLTPTIALGNQKSLANPQVPFLESGRGQ